MGRALQKLAAVGVHRMYLYANGKNPIGATTLIDVRCRLWPQLQRFANYEAALSHAFFLFYPHPVSTGDALHRWHAVARIPVCRSGVAGDRRREEVMLLVPLLRLRAHRHARQPNQEETRER